MSKSELLPCPFCGGEAEVFAGALYEVQCRNCYRAGTWLCDTEAKAIKAWNTRAETRAERDLRDEVNWLHAELHGAEMEASGETVLLDEQYSHAMRLVEELHQVLSLNGGGYLDEFGSHEG